MRKFPVWTGVAAGAGLSWCGLAAYWLAPYREPLMGFGSRECAQMMCFEILLAVVFVALAHYRKRMMAGVIGGLSLLSVIALPLASKAGVLFRFQSNVPTGTEVGVARADDPKRRVLLLVPAGQRSNYRTAPGDYSEGVRFILESGTRHLTTDVGELRKRVVHISETDLWLSEPDKK